MRILFLGGSVFVGRSIVSQLVADGHDVSLLNRGSRPVEGTRQLIADCNDRGAIRDALAGRAFDWVIDTLTASTQQADGFCDALEGRYSGWLYISSSAVYAEDGSYPMAETHPTGTSTAWGDYGLSKLESERQLARRTERAGKPFVSLRPPYIYGPANPVPREHWLWSRLLAERPILVPNDGDTPIQFLFASDLAQIVKRVIEQRDLTGIHIYNVGEPHWISMRAYLETLARVSGTKLDLRPIPYRSLDIKPRDFFPFRDYACVLDPSKIERELGWTPKNSLEHNLSLTFQQTDPTRLNTPLDTQAEEKILARLP